MAERGQQDNSIASRTMTPNMPINIQNIQQKSICLGRNSLFALYRGLRRTKAGLKGNAAQGQNRSSWLGDEE